jgi:hypothetical protein
MAKFMEVNAAEVHPDFMEVQARGIEAEKAVNDKTTSKFLQEKKGTVEISAYEGMKYHGVKTTTAKEAFHGGLPGTVMSTVTSKTGMPISDQTQLTPDSLVTIGGMQCSLETAVRMGLVVRQADGTYADSRNPASVRQVQNPKEAADYDKAAQQWDTITPVADFMDVAGWAAVNTARATIGRDEADTVILRAITSHLGGGNPEPAVKEFASAMQIEPEQAVNMLEGIAYGSLDRAAQYISGRHNGVDGQEVLEWAGKNLRSATKASIMAAIYNGAVSELDKLVQKYRIKERY